MKLLLDPTKCDGFGFCAELLGDVVALDEWGFPVLAGGNLPAERLRAARQAAKMCPRRAIQVVP
ncbi:MAG TPA: ferredoxin [Acidimicrobiales bacterium]|nr:ferredoxin [Acidimicrobiales bacterium]